MFSATDATHGTELWATNGTAAGTTLVRDIDPGAANASPASFAIMTVAAAPVITGYVPSGGASAFGTYSDTGMLAISGTTTETAQSVQVFDGAKLVGTGGPPGAGAWSVTLSASLAPGVHDLTAEIAVGNIVSPASNVLAVTVVAPAADPLFDTAYYLAHNPDVAASSIDPYQHFLAFGWREGRNPSALFDVSYYLTHNPDVRAAGVNPLQHFETIGWTEGRDPSGAFSLRDYLAANPDVKAAGVDPLLQYATAGKAQGRAIFAVTDVPPDPLVDAAYYYARNPDVKAAGFDATAHYDALGWREGRDPDAFFDGNYYLAHNPDVKAAGIDPLQHFESFGWAEGRQPSLLFDDAKYLAANQDVKAAGINPLLHYLNNGQFEGRPALLSGGAAAADPLVSAPYYDAQLGATLVPAGTAGAQQAAWSYDATGWQRGLNPDALFDTRYYLSHNPDVAAAHIDPLLHYETSGWHEGRDPSAAFSTNKYLAAYPDVRAAGVDPLLDYLTAGPAAGRVLFAV